MMSGVVACRRPLSLTVVAVWRVLLQSIPGLEEWIDLKHCIFSLIIFTWLEELSPSVIKCSTLFEHVYISKPKAMHIYFGRTSVGHMVGFACEEKNKSIQNWSRRPEATHPESLYELVHCSWVFTFNDSTCPLSYPLYFWFKYTFIILKISRPPPSHNIHTQYKIIL